jgi:hypothetical protein
MTKRRGRPQAKCERCRILGRWNLARHLVRIGQTVTHVCRVCADSLTECGGREVEGEAHG